MDSLYTSRLKNEQLLDNSVLQRERFISEVAGSSKAAIEDRSQPKVSQPWNTVYMDGQLLGHFVMNDTGQVRTRCFICKKLYKCKLTLVRHWRQMHGFHGGYSCQHCGKRFGQKSNLRDHLQCCGNQGPTPRQISLEQLPLQKQVIQEASQSEQIPYESSEEQDNSDNTVSGQAVIPESSMDLLLPAE